jgi:hypothetical protein
MCEKYLTVPASDASCHAETQAKHLTGKKKDPLQAQDDGIPAIATACVRSKERQRRILSC